MSTDHYDQTTGEDVAILDKSFQQLIENYRDRVTTNIFYTLFSFYAADMMNQMLAAAAARAKESKEAQDVRTD
jgi:hypothetical protein